MKNIPKMHIGIDNFKTLVLNSDVFVDKNLMVKAFLEDSGAVILITRPRRWGKSLNVDMLHKFFNIEVDGEGRLLPQEERINYKLFCGGKVDLGFASGKKKELQQLQIAKHKDIIVDYQGQFPVISITFKNVKGGSYQEIEDSIKTRVTKLFNNHRYLKHYIAEDETLLDDFQKTKLNRYFTGELYKEDLNDSLGFLSELLFKHFGQKVYILIDEYDTPINSAYIKFGHEYKELEKVLELFHELFGAGLKTNPYLEKGLITGILRLAKANLFSDLNNVAEYTLLDKKFARFYGFTQSEVDELLMQVPLNTDLEEIKSTT